MCLTNMFLDYYYMSFDASRIETDLLYGKFDISSSTEKVSSIKVQKTFNFNGILFLKCKFLY